MLRRRTHGSPRALLHGAGAATASILLASVALDATPAPADGAKWQEVALEGEFKGYGGGEQPFTFDKARFDALVKNFRAHPSYKAGSDGVGCADVVAWDFSHASEYPPFMGELPTAGAPAQGWVQELDVRLRADGTTYSLWALTRWLEPAKTYIAEGRYKWASVAVNLEAVDAVSGEALGPVLTSIAITNSPFIEGMLELAATRRGVSPGRLESVPGRLEQVRADYYYSAAATVEDAIGCFRSLFGLPVTATSEEVAAELQKLSGMTQGTVPTDASIELDDIVGAVRQILGLGVLKTTPEVITEALAFIGGLADGKDNGVSATSSNAGRARSGEDDDMDIIKILAGKLGTRETAEAVVTAVDGLFDFCKTIAVKLKKPDVATSVLLTDVVRLVDESGDIRAKLEAMASALGVQDPAMAVAKLAEMVQNSAKLVELMPELEALRAQVGELEEEQEVMDVAAARDFHFAGDQKVDKLLALTRKQLGREKFFEEYPLPDETTAHLTTDVSGSAGAPNAPALRAPGARGAPPAWVAASRAPAPAGSAARHPGRTPQRVVADGSGRNVQLAPDAVDISDQPGPNLTAKAMAHVRATVPGADKWDHEDLWVHAAKMVDQRRVFTRQPATH